MARRKTKGFTERDVIDGAMVMVRGLTDGSVDVKVAKAAYGLYNQANRGLRLELDRTELRRKQRKR